MQSVVTNSTVDGVLTALFAVLIIVVVADAARIWVRVLRTREVMPDTEVPKVPSRIVAPPGCSSPRRSARSRRPPTPPTARLPGIATSWPPRA